MIRVAMPAHLRTLAGVSGDVTLEIEGEVRDRGFRERDSNPGDWRPSVCRPRASRPSRKTGELSGISTEVIKMTAHNRNTAVGVRAIGRQQRLLSTHLHSHISDCTTYFLRESCCWGRVGVGIAGCCLCDTNFCGARGRLGHSSRSPGAEIPLAGADTRYHRARDLGLQLHRPHCRLARRSVRAEGRQAQASGQQFLVSRFQLLVDLRLMRPHRLAAFRAAF